MRFISILFVLYHTSTASKAVEWFTKTIGLDKASAVVGNAVASLTQPLVPADEEFKNALATINQKLEGNTYASNRMAEYFGKEEISSKYSHLEEYLAISTKVLVESDLGMDVQVLFLLAYHDLAEKYPELAITSNWTKLTTKFSETMTALSMFLNDRCTTPKENTNPSCALLSIVVYHLVDACSGNAWLSSGPSGDDTLIDNTYTKLLNLLDPDDETVPGFYHRFMNMIAPKNEFENSDLVFELLSSFSSPESYEKPKSMFSRILGV